MRGRVGRGGNEYISSSHRRSEPTPDLEAAVGAKRRGVGLVLAAVERR
jgi:hypothetical protein